MKRYFLLFMTICLISFLSAQNSYNYQMPVIQIQKFIISKNTTKGDKILFYIGKFVDSMGVSRYVRFKLEHYIPGYPPEIYQGYIYEEEFDKLINAIPNLKKKVDFAKQYPAEYTASYFYIFEDDTRIGFTKNQDGINWYIRLQGKIVPITRSNLLQSILEQYVKEAREI